MTTPEPAARQKAMTPDDVLAELKAGNARFRAGTPVHGDARQAVEATRGGQWPLAAIVGCIDSRAAPELILDQGIGDLFSARVAGNIVNGDILGSLEFATKVAGAKLVVVMGHTQCGAVKGACDGVQLGNLTGLLEQIGPALREVTEPSDPSQRTSANGAFVQAVAEANVTATLAALRSRSEVLAGLESEGAIRVVGAMYDVATGEVRFDG